jgi:hypothetical protein
MFAGPRFDKQCREFVIPITGKEIRSTRSLGKRIRNRAQ